jgi:hypothetical protein
MIRGDSMFPTWLNGETSMQWCYTRSLATILSLPSFLVRKENCCSLLEITDSVRTLVADVLATPSNYFTGTVNYSIPLACYKGYLKFLRTHWLYSSSVLENTRKLGVTITRQASKTPRPLLSSPQYYSTPPLLHLLSTPCHHEVFGTKIRSNRRVLQIFPVGCCSPWSSRLG